MASTQQTPALFKPVKVGWITLQHRVVLAPLTRNRVYASHVPGPQQLSYYAQRASAPGSLLIAEATLISNDAGGFNYVPGIYTDAQIQGWKKVTDAVHAKGSYIFLQLWALGRVANPDVLEAGSAFTICLRISKPPRPLTEAEIKDYIVAYAKAARNAVHGAGFDGVEIHGANVFLPDRFLQTTSNIRSDAWGGGEQGRSRFAREIVDAVVDAVGEDRVGIRVSPWSMFQDMKMPNPRPTFAYLVTALRDKHPRLAYLHAVEPRVFGGTDIVSGPEESNDFLREIWNGGEAGQERIFISAGGHTRETALHTAEDQGGFVASGRLYVLNPDPPTRLKRNLSLTPVDSPVFYLAGNLTPFGYNDWPFADGTVPEVEARA